MLGYSQEYEFASYDMKDGGKRIEKRVGEEIIWTL